jgi:hypothetical protein
MLVSSCVILFSGECELIGDTGDQLVTESITLIKASLYHCP